MWSAVRYTAKAFRNSVNDSLSGGTDARHTPRGRRVLPQALWSPLSPRPPLDPPPQLQTWYLLVELKGISTILGYRSLISFTDPQHSSMHFKSADSEASPATARCGHRRYPSGSPKTLHRGATSDEGKRPGRCPHLGGRRGGRGRSSSSDAGRRSPGRSHAHTHTHIFV